VNDAQRIIAERTAGCGLEVSQPEPGEPWILAVYHPVASRYPEAQSSRYETSWKLHDSADEDTGPGVIAAEVIRLVSGGGAADGTGS
jgi:hypothetical protein